MIAVISKLNNVSSYNFSRSIQACSENSENPKPSSTKCHLNHEPYPCHVERGDSGPEIDCRIIGTETLLARSQDLLRLYLPACLRAAYELLGSHPFLKLDILILPRCYSGLGLASPSLVIFNHQRCTRGGGGGGREAPHVPPLKIFRKLPHKNAIKHPPP
jgi:hypothetical protein